MPFGGVLNRLLGTPVNLKEAIGAADDVTYWASDDKAWRELGHSPVISTLACGSPSPQADRPIHCLRVTVVTG